MAIKREANFTTTFRHWLRANPRPSAAFELKQTTSDSLPFGAVQPHQLDALEAARGNTGLLYKAPDDSRGIKPCDLLYLRFSEAFVVIKYPNCFVLIDNRVFTEEMKSSKRRSLTSSRAKEISTTYVLLK